MGDVDVNHYHHLLLFFSSKKDVRSSQVDSDVTNDGRATLCALSDSIVNARTRDQFTFQLLNFKHWDQFPIIAVGQKCFHKMVKQYTNVHESK